MQIEISTANEITYRGDLGSFLRETSFGYNNFNTGRTYGGSA